MIAVKLMGGLGNQMFQYALGRHLSLLRDTQLFLDLSFLNIRAGVDYTLRNYELNNFNVKATCKDRYYKNDIFSRAVNVLKRVRYVSERSTVFDPSILASKGNIYFNGFWQSERYFTAIRETLLKDFRPSKKLSALNSDILNRISAANSVSIHVRRGDYVNNAVAAARHGNCGLNYYKEAIELIRSKESDIEFFIFSDDPQWVKENFRFNEPHLFIEHNKGAESYNDLLLMSNCKHNIIANSSFSWWGGWLNNNDNKIVIGPQEWLADSSVDTSDIMPESWIKI